MSSIQTNTVGTTTTTITTNESANVTNPISNFFTYNNLSFNLNGSNIGIKTQSECENACGYDINCNNYSLSFPSKFGPNYNNKYDCHLTMSNTKTNFIIGDSNNSGKGNFNKNDKKKVYKNSLNISDDYEVLGNFTGNASVPFNTMCRSSTENVQGNAIGKGYQYAQNCASICKNTKGCTSFDIARRDNNGKYDCYIFTFKDKSRIIGESRNTGGAQGCFKKIK